MEISYFSLLIWFTSILVASLCIVIYLGSQKLSSQAFAHSILWVAIWVACVGLFVAVQNSQEAIFFSRLTYYLGSVIAASFIYFFLTYPEDKKPKKILTWSLILLELVFAYLFLFTDKIITRTFPTNIPQFLGWKFGPFSYLFELFFFGFFIVGIIILYKKYKSNNDPYTKQNLRYMLWAIIIGSVPPSITCIILPRFGYYNLNWFGPFSEIIWIPIIAYSIIRYRQMNVKVVITEVLAIAMAVIFFINIFIDIPFGTWGRIAAFIVFLVLAYYLIRSALREAKQRELLANLNLHLEQKVAEQTIEIRKSYELEKKARRELEKLNETKDQFIMITQHHLRTPVTSIRWGLEAMLKGTYGVPQPELRRAIEDTNTAANRLMRIVDDFLSITALKVGSQILNLAPASMKPLLTDVLAELRYDIESKRLAIRYPTTPQEWPELHMDASKMREVILIGLENAVRYNIPDGSISIATRLDGPMFEMTIENTGMGILPEDRKRLFTSLFYRSDSARAAHPIGMGVGLSVSRAIVRAHHGELLIGSEGKDCGARLTIRLPLEQAPA